MTTALDSSCFEFFEFWIWTNHNSLLSIATNRFASFFIDIRSRQSYFRVCQTGEIWNKRAFFPCILIFLLYKTNRFHVAVRLFSNRSQRTSKCGKNISDTLGCASCATFLFLPHFDVICDLLLNRRTATWNLFVNQTILLVKGEPLGRERVNNVKTYVPINPLTAEWALWALIDFTLSNARRFYSSKGNHLDGKGLEKFRFCFISV